MDRTKAKLYLTIWLACAPAQAEVGHSGPGAKPKPKPPTSFLAELKADAAKYYAMALDSLDSLKNPKPDNPNADEPAPERYAAKLPAYDQDRVLRATQEMVETFRQTRPDSWEALEQISGDARWNQDQDLPPFDRAVVSRAVESLATEIAETRPTSWQALNGVLKSYTKDIPPSVMENVIANRLLQRQASEKEQDRLSGGDKEKASGRDEGPGNLNQAVKTADQQAQSKIGLFNQFLPGTNQAAAPALPSAQGTSFSPAVNSPVVGSGSTFGGRGFGASSGGGFGGVSGGREREEPAPEAPGKVAGASAPADTTSPDKAESRSPASVAASEPGKASPAGGTDPVAAGDKLGTTGTNEAAPGKESEPGAGKPTLAGTATSIGEGTALTVGSISPTQTVSPFSLDEPKEPPAATAAEAASGASAPVNGETEEAVSEGGSQPAAYAEEEAEEEMVWLGFQGFLARWILNAIDLDSVPGTVTPVKRGLASRLVRRAGAEQDEAFEGFFGSRAARHERIIKWGGAVGLSPEKALFLYHGALALAWLATFAFAVYAGWRWRRWRLLQDRGIGSSGI